MDEKEIAEANKEIRAVVRPERPPGHIDEQRASGWYAGETDG